MIACCCEAVSIVIFISQIHVGHFVGVITSALCDLEEMNIRVS